MAAAAKAIAEAGITLPPMPAECWRDVPHASLVEGQEPRVTLSREGYQLNKANAQGADCVAFYADLRQGAAK